MYNNFTSLCTMIQKDLYPQKQIVASRCESSYLEYGCTYEGNFLCLHSNCLANCRHDNLKHHNASSSTTTNPSKLANDEELRAHRKIMIEVKL